MKKFFLGLTLIALITWILGCGGERVEPSSEPSVPTAVTVDSQSDPTERPQETHQEIEEKPQETGGHPALMDYPEDPLRVGETRQSTNGSLKMTLVQVQDPGESKVSYIPDEGERLVTVELELENTDTTGKAAYSSVSFTLVDGQGNQFKSTTRPTPLPELRSESLEPEGQVVGAFSFVVPEGASGLMMIYVPYAGFPPELVFDLQNG